LFVRKSVQDVEKELSNLNKRVENLEKELKRVENLERMQAQHEIILAKKISDINRFDAELTKIVKKDELEEMKIELKRLEEHDAVLTENSRLMREIINEVGKVRDAHKRTRQQLFEKGHLSKEDFEDRLGEVSKALEELENIRATHKKKVSKAELEVIRKELHERMGQIEHQNKILMVYLKKVDELLQKKES